MKKRKKYLVILFFILIVGLPFKVSADGCWISLKKDVSVYGPGQKAIIAWNGSEEVLILSVDVWSTKDSPILRIIPLPSKPDIEKGNFTSFEKIENLIWKHSPFKYLPPSNIPWLGQDTSLPKLEIVFHEKIGAHDITVVKANDFQEFVNWTINYLEKRLRINNNTTNKISNLKSVISHYMGKKINYFVFDLIQANKSTKSVEPIIYKFKSNSLYFPLVASSVIPGCSEIDVFAITPCMLNMSTISEFRIGFYKIQYPFPYPPYYYPPYPYYDWHRYSAYPIEFEVTKEELDSINPEISKLFNESAWFTALKYYGPLKDLKEDLEANILCLEENSKLI